MATIAELLQEQGRQAAESRRQQGAQSAQLWSGVGNSLASALTDYAKQRQEQPFIDAQRKLAVAQAGKVDEDAQLKALFHGDKPPTPAQIVNVVGPERGLSIVKGLQALQGDPKQGYDDTQKVLRDTLQGMNALPESLRQEYYPTVRGHLIQRGVIKPDDAPEQYDSNWWQSTANYGQKPAEPLKPVPVDSVDASGKAVTTFVTPTPGLSVPKPTPEPKPDTRSLQEQANDALRQGDTAGYKRIIGVIRDTAAAGRAPDPLAALVGGQNATGASSAAAKGLTGEDFLKTLDRGTASEVKAYAEGKRPFPTGMSYAKLQPLIQLVGQYDPTFDASNYNARNKARTDLTSPSGTGGKTINAINTALQHAGTLSDLIETLDNYESPAANAILNPLRTVAGSTKVTNFDAVAPQLMKEIERAWRGTGGSAGEIQDLVNSIGHNKGKQQQREALSQFVNLLQGKLDATQQQRDNIMGPAAAQIPVLFSQNEPVIAKIADRASGESSTSGPKVGEVRTYNGETRKWDGAQWVKQ